MPTFFFFFCITTLVQLLWSHIHALWELKNTGPHGSNIKESRGKRLKLLRQRVRQLYDHEDRKFVPSSKQASYFGLPLSQRKKQGLYSLTSWIQFIERQLHYHQEEAMKRTIHAWLKKEKTCCLKETTSWHTTYSQNLVLFFYLLLAEAIPAMGRNECPNGG